MIKSKTIFRCLILATFFFGSSAFAQDPLLIGGRPAKPGEFPEAVYINFGGGRCTGSIIGPRVLLSAAHCARNGSSGTFQIGQSLYKVSECRHHPSYPGSDVDLMLCVVNREVDTSFASLPPEGFGLSRGDKITIVGYGCIRPGGGGGNDGVLRVGDAKVTGFSGQDIVSKGSGLCFGDSGGPAYVPMSDAFAQAHIQVSVNSKGNIRDTNYTARTYNDTARSFIAKFAKDKGLDICGVTTDCVTPIEPNCVEEKKDHKYLLARAALAKDIVDSCLKESAEL